MIEEYKEQRDMKEELMELIRNMVADDEMELTEDSRICR